jgi:hypothetical protein
MAGLSHYSRTPSFLTDLTLHLLRSSLAFTGVWAVWHVNAAISQSDEGDGIHRGYYALGALGAHHRNIHDLLTYSFIGPYGSTDPSLSDPPPSS